MTDPIRQQPSKNEGPIHESTHQQVDMAASKNNSNLPHVPDNYFFHSKTHIEEGDIVIVFMTRESLQAITVTRGQMFHNKWGKYSHDDMIGRKYGSKMTSPPPQPGYVHLLRPTPELWTLSLPHRTQIVYLPDISFITNELRIRPGSRVIEAGTGSGSMSHSLARTIGYGEGSEDEWKSGPKLFSFEYHATRYEKALLRHRNVCKDGFGEEPSDIDAVFLDLPAPWEAIPHVVKALRADLSTRICCYSPCIEQVTRTVAALDAEGFVDIQMFEVLAKPIEVTLPQPEFQTVSSISAKLRRQEIRKEQRRRYQVESSKKRKLADTAPTDEIPSGDGDQSMEDVSKRPKVAGAEGETARPTTAVHDHSTTMPSEKSELGIMLDQVEEEEEEWFLDSNTLNFKPVIDVRGHTSYLTFATMYPLPVRQQLEERDQHKREAVMKRTAELAGLPSTPAAKASGGAASSSVNVPNSSLPWPSQATSKDSAEFNTSYTRGVDELIAELPSQPLPDASAPRPPVQR
ncbi:hypothetical protein QFC19_000771 [Naganishia cerealis]|uniref:Uncharacterized protein n=1 Tax=Naganishia cerealis TaxID=610337 RepID=A0ACC2WMP5_9TREE|nr:hypothetical protein QFC19_000771 [Naganishia cerealis]